MAQNGKVNPDCSYPANPYHECTETCLREAPPQKSSDHGYPSKVRASSRSEKKKLETETNEYNVSSETVFTEKHIQDVMDSKDDWYGCIGGSPINIIFWLCVFTCLAEIQAILFRMSFPSQQHWLLPMESFLILLFIIFSVSLYAYVHLALTPAPPIPSILPPPVPSMPLPLSSRPSPLLSMPAA